MPHGRDGLELVVDEFETAVKHASTPYELHVRAEAGQIVESQHDAPHGAGLAIDGGRGKHVVNVHGHADQREVPQQVLVESLQDRVGAGHSRSVGGRH